jgi:hypothetical protein
MTRLTRAKDALARALLNDSRGVVSEKDATQIVDAAVSEISRASDPEAKFQANKRYLKAAREVLGYDVDAGKILRSYDARGMSAVTARLAMLSGGPVLPPPLKTAFDDMVRWGGLEGVTEAAIVGVRGSEDTGFVFDWQAGSRTGTAYAIRHQGEHVLSPVDLTSAELQKATDIAKRYFDEHWAPELKDNGASDAEVAEMRRGIRATGVLFDGQEDPVGLGDSYPVVVSMENTTGSDHGFWVGFNPATGEGEAATFN